MAKIARTKMIDLGIKFETNHGDKSYLQIRQ